MVYGPCEWSTDQYGGINWLIDTSLHFISTKITTIVTSSWLPAIQICPLLKALLNLNVSQPLNATEWTPFSISRRHLGLFNDAKYEGMGMVVFGGFKHFWLDFFFLW